MGIKRDQFRDTTSVKQLKDDDRKVERLNQREQQDFAGYLSVEDGENLFRLYPPHPNKGNHPFVQPKQLWWLPWMYEEKDDDGNVIKDKKGNPKLNKGKKRIFDARIHSAAGADVVNEYIEFLKKSLEDKGMSDDEVTEAMLPVYGSYQRKVQGIVGKPGWVVYADKYNGSGGKEFGRLEIGKAIKYRLNDIIAREQSDEPIGTVSQNPFTDPDDGRLLIVTYNPDAKKAADYYKTEIDSSFDKKTKQINLVPLSDDELENFTKFPSLHSMFVNVYTTEDFEMAVQGLKIFDDDNEFGIFEYEAWNEKLAEMASLYPDPKDEGDSVDEELDEEEDDDDNMNDGGPEYQGGDEEEDDEPEETNDVLEGDQYDHMDRNELKVFIRDNAIPIVVRKGMDDDDIRNAIREALSEAEEEEEPIEEEAEETPAKKPSRKSLKDKY